MEEHGKRLSRLEVLLSKALDGAMTAEEKRECRKLLKKLEEEGEPSEEPLARCGGPCVTVKSAASAFFAGFGLAMILTPLCLAAFWGGMRGLAWAAEYFSVPLVPVVCVVLCAVLGAILLGCSGRLGLWLETLLDDDCDEK